MLAEQIAALRAAVVEAASKHGTFIEYLDDDDTQQIVTAVAQRNGEMVASLASGGYVPLSLDEVSACDFRRVSPAVPPECPGRDCERCPLQPVCPDWLSPEKRANYFHGVLPGLDVLPGYDPPPSAARPPCET